MTRRGELVARIRAQMRELQPGQSVTVVLPEGQPANRDAYLKVNTAALSLWGTGGFSLRKNGSDVLVTRTVPRAGGAARP